ncbi:MAG: extracellular solute-binding protein [Candidatus Omnitrophica bacterium]|nr:extracellular solute-binding protein [Candidatus Omnitrophota bacterium]MBU1852689.1 extracellular solute-binding protein [Candidatus Omnitrophota bacterium]
MKKILSSLLVIGLLLGMEIQLNHAEAKKEESEGTITMSGAWALYPMAVKWAEEFQKIHPKVKIDVAAGGAGKGMADALASVVDIGNVSRDIYPEEIKKGAWFVAVTKDAVVPTVNENNPLKEEILLKGIKRKDFIRIWIAGDVTDWKDVVSVSEKVSGKTDLHVYTRSDACGAAKTWAKYLGEKQEDLLGVGVYGDPGVAEAVRKDVLGIGFNNINYAYDAKSKRQVKGIKVLPIDLNGNGRIDEDEDFYNSRDEITEAIATGKYPSPPVRDLHFVSQGKPKRKVVTEFIRWVLTEGQKYVPEAGYINLTEEKLQEGLKKLEDE